MIDTFHLKLFKQFGPNSGTAVLLGDQVPYEATGFRTSREMMLSLGYASCLDIDYNGNASENLDLNQALPRRLYGIADFVFDGGVIEHVSNISEALVSIVRLCKPGGVIVVNNPCNDYRMLYYNLDPLIKHDFFEANGFKTLHEIIHYRHNVRLWALRMAVRFLPPNVLESWRLRFKKQAENGNGHVKSFVFQDKLRHVRTKPVDKFYYRLPALSSATYVGRKTREVVTIKWPHQSIYAATANGRHAANCSDEWNDIAGEKPAEELLLAGGRLNADRPLSYSPKSIN